MKKPFTLLAALFVISVAMHSAIANEFVAIAGGVFDSVIPEDENDNSIVVSSFLIQQSPVTNGEFLRFVLENPQWQRGSAVELFVDDQYLAGWDGPISLGESVNVHQPVLQVSWFSAVAYCEAQSARLPTWYEWEFVAAASEITSDGRSDDKWRQEILSWYAQSKSVDIDQVRSRRPNFYGVYDMHGLIWEWVDDYGALLVTGDNREQGGADKLLFCGAGAITMEEKENYAVLMRVAMLSALEARYTTRNLGFRCARSDKGT